MSITSRLRYYQRIAAAYVLRRGSQLTFWHETPEANPASSFDDLGGYYMSFTQKADYPGPFDADDIPLLNYHGAIGIQHNPIAIAQYGLANLNLHQNAGDPDRLKRALNVADWLVRNLETNEAGVRVWRHHFDWDYRSRLIAPWPSALAQGQAISMLVRAHKITGDASYLDTATLAFAAFTIPVDRGGLTFWDDAGSPWFEEYLVSPPTHILNGFIWAAWGVYDYWLATSDVKAKELFDAAIGTIADNLPRYDCGYWSLYEQSGTRLPMIASPFYHRLHIVQLGALHQMTGQQVFEDYAKRWVRFRASRVRRSAAFVHKAIFKVLHY
jgi:heparosan-N-sulfate-glucuronate 5-epimerase